MASGFLVPDRDQAFLRATSYRELLGDDELVWTVIEVIEGLDLSGIYAGYGVDTGQGGRPAFDPAMMLTLLVFGYCEGKRSARELESACRRDVAYQAICGGMTPDHATIARFRVAVDDVIELLFVQVLAVCAERGLVDVGRVALDGTKMEAAASKGSNRSIERLATLRATVEQILSETTLETSDPEPSHTDADVTGGTGDGRPGDDAFEEGFFAAYDIGSDAGDAAVDRGDDGGGWSLLRRERQLRGLSERIGAAEAEAERSRLAREHDEKRRGRKRGGIPTANPVDPDSRLQKTADGRFVQGYNGQASTSADQITLAPLLTAEGTDVAQLEPMIKKTMQNLAAAGIGDQIGVLLADAGYWSLDNSRLEDDLDGTILLIAAGDKTHRVGNQPEPLSERASDAAQARHAMQTRLADPEMRDSYRQRSWLIEGCFAHTKTHRGIKRFSRRGLAACQAEWALIHLAGNINKIHNTRHRRGGDGPNPPPDTPTTPFHTPTRQPTARVTARNGRWHQPRRPHHRHR